MTLAERAEARADIVADETVRGGEHQAAKPGAGAAAAGIGDAGDGERRLLRRQRRLAQLSADTSVGS